VSECPEEWWATVYRAGHKYLIEKMRKKFNIVIEKDEDGYYVASVPELPGCHTQAKTLDELTERIEEAIKLYLEVEKGATDIATEFVGVQVVEVSV